MCGKQGTCPRLSCGCLRAHTQVGSVVLCFAVKAWHPLCHGPKLCVDYKPFLERDRSVMAPSYREQASHRRPFSSSNFRTSSLVYVLVTNVHSTGARMDSPWVVTFLFRERKCYPRDDTGNSFDPYPQTKSSQQTQKTDRRPRGPKSPCPFSLDHENPAT